MSESNPHVFRRNWLSTTTLAVAFVGLGLATSAAILHLAWRANASPPVFLAEMIGDRAPAERARAIAELAALHGPPIAPFPGPPFDPPARAPAPPQGGPPGAPWPRPPKPELVLLDARGAALFPSGQKPAFEWAELRLPERAYDSVKVPSGTDPSASAWVVRLPGEPTQYLLMDGFIGGMPPSPLRALAIALGCLAISMLLGIGAALSILFRSLEAKVRLIDEVMARLRSGDLKARIPIAKMDDVGRAMTRFNLMAEEIERLVESLRSAEGARTRLLQELAHDLRTPIAGLRSSIETLSEPRRLEPGMREELFQISKREVEYLHRLVDDLLALATVSDPSFAAERRSVNLAELIDEEAAAAEMKRRREPDAPALTLRLPDAPVEVVGDPHLLRRMMRNGLDNAFDFARSEVRVTLAFDEGQAWLEIADDGPGFSPEAAAAFGVRRLTRARDERRNGRISIGLGSVIMKAVAESHRGSVAARNAADDSAEGPGGALVRIVLPRAG